MNIHRSVGMLLAGTCAIFAAGPAYGQDVTTQAAAAQPLPAQAQADQNAIIITAQKRAQLLLDVPQSVTVVSGGTLEQQHANSFQDYLKLVPGLQLDQSRAGEGRLILRGVNTGGVASTVGVYVDETPFGSSSGLVNGAVLAGDFDPFDLSRIEVLRGPQGTLYGASSLSGVLRFVTNAPSTERFETRARAGIETVSGGGLAIMPMQSSTCRWGGPSPSARRAATARMPASSTRSATAARTSLATRLPPTGQRISMGTAVTADAPRCCSSRAERFQSACRQSSRTSSPMRPRWSRPIR
ncbi:MAG: TonB-dependent receptor plug domain-containing protein [Bacillota bacterium]